MQDQATTLAPSPARRLLPRFPLGNLVATPGAMGVLDGNQEVILKMLNRHVTGDWGELDEDDRQTNECALQSGGRIFSTYTELDTKFYVITESDRSLTTILLPEEY